MRIKCIIVSLILIVLSLPVCGAENIACDEFYKYIEGRKYDKANKIPVNSSMNVDMLLIFW